jgi:hypothetical protein
MPLACKRLVEALLGFALGHFTSRFRWAKKASGPIMMGGGWKTPGSFPFQTVAIIAKGYASTFLPSFQTRITTPK